MPKHSKISSSRLKDPKPPAPERDDYYCCRCGKKYKKQKTNFSVSQSPMYKGNGGYFPICHSCMDEIYDHYRDVLNSDMIALRRMCMKFDMYWNEKIYRASMTTNAGSSRIRAYISRCNLINYIGKTYDDTLDEENGLLTNPPPRAVPENELPEEQRLGGLSMDDIDPELIQFWGIGYTPEVYLDLERRFNRWTNGNVAYAHDDPAQESILKQICILERRIELAGMNGSKISDDISSFNNLLGSANLKPSQKKADAATSDTTPFGIWIQRWENERPVPEPDPDFADADNIVRYISIWFLGHLCKMLKIKNSYSRMYEQEIERLRVERPEYVGDDDEEFFQDVFEAGGG